FRSQSWPPCEQVLTGPFTHQHERCPVGWRDGDTQCWPRPPQRRLALTPPRWRLTLGPGLQPEATWPAPCGVRGAALTIGGAAAFVQRVAPRWPQPVAPVDLRTRPKSGSAEAVGGCCPRASRPRPPRARPTPTRPATSPRRS